ncbi:hypothetical protein MRX96_005224 [Rhipicephalus microplus]
MDAFQLDRGQRFRGGISREQDACPGANRRGCPMTSIKRPAFDIPCPWPPKRCAAVQAAARFPAPGQKGGRTLLAPAATGVS